jgi:hypothetical protein
VPKPVLQALVLADHVYQDKSTGKMVIAGTFNQFHVFKQSPPGAAGAAGAAGAPAEASQPGPGGEQAQERTRKLQNWQVGKAGSPWAYVSVTDLHGTVPLELRYVDLSNNAVLLKAEFSVAANSPLDTREVAIPLPELPRPHPGTYALELLFNDEPLGAHRVAVFEVPSPDQPPTEPGQT